MLVHSLQATTQQFDGSTVSNKPTTTFKLSIRDVEIIEEALRAKAGRRGMAIAQGATSDRLREEMNEIQAVLGRLHDQKNHYGRFKDGKTYVSG